MDRDTVRLGISKEQAGDLALQILGALKQGKAQSLVFTESLPDVLFALVQRMTVRGGTKEAGFVLERLYQGIADLEWPRDEFSEKAQLLAETARLAWSQSLGIGAASEVWRWEQECFRQSVVQEDVQQLLRMRTSHWSPAVCDRYLSDRTFLLALCVSLSAGVDSAPRSTFELALVVYEWLSSHLGEEATRKEESYLLARLSCLLAGTSKMLGKYKHNRDWLCMARKWCATSSNAEAVQTRVDYLRLALLTEMYQYEIVLAEIPSLIERSKKLGLEDDLAKCKYLHAYALKASVGGDSALRALDSLISDPVVVRRPWLRGLVFVSLAELQNGQGDVSSALSSIREANALLHDAEKPFATAYCCGMTAEILRDLGELDAALTYYRRAAQIYSDVDMAAFAVYARLVLAESLVAANRVDEAVDEIVAALPVIERENLVREGIAAVGLLKASLARRQLDPDALRAVRESIDRARREAEL